MGWSLSFQPLPRAFGVLDAGGRSAHLWLAAKQRPFAAPKHNPATVMRAKIKQLERTTRSRGLGRVLVSQPPELVLNSVGSGAEFGGDPAQQDVAPLDVV
jgi:hypothetical protein